MDFRVAGSETLVVPCGCCSLNFFKFADFLIDLTKRQAFSFNA